MPPLGGAEAHDASVRCMDVSSGRVQWEQRVQSKGESMVSLTAASGRLIIMNGAGTIAVAEASPKAYTEIARCSLKTLVMPGNRFWTPPVLCNGLLYCRGYLGELICIDVRR